MTSSANHLKEQMRRVGAVKAQDAADALAEHLKLSIGERIEAGVRLSQALLNASRSSRPGAVEQQARASDIDDEAATMARVAAHLKRLQLAKRGRRDDDGQRTNGSDREQA